MMKSDGKLKQAYTINFNVVRMTRDFYFQCILIVDVSSWKNTKSKSSTILIPLLCTGVEVDMLGYEIIMSIDTYPLERMEKPRHPSWLNCAIGAESYWPWAS